MDKVGLPYDISIFKNQNYVIIKANFFWSFTPAKKPG